MAAKAGGKRTIQRAYKDMHMALPQKQLHVQVPRDVAKVRLIRKYYQIFFPDFNAVLSFAPQGKEQSEAKTPMTWQCALDKEMSEPFRVSFLGVSANTSIAAGY